jgi:acetylornithine/N-succinyldiaminopimelate aminotransferase
MEHILKCHEIVKTDFVRGQNCSLYDAAGKRYLDFESGTWCTALGHNPAPINKVIEAQLKQVIHLGTRYPNGLVEETAQAVLKIVGFEAGKCTFLSSGSEAVEFGVQAIRRISAKPLLLTFQNSFLASYGSAGRKELGEWCLFDWMKNGASEDPLAGLETIPFDHIGGFAFEPGGSGIGLLHFPPTALVREIVRRVRQAGGLVLANEVTTGMGRTGKWFGYQHYEIQPDIVAIGKGLGNGYPVSAVALRREVAEELEQSGFHYAQSHQNDPLGCAVAREVITLFREGDWVRKGNAVGRFFLDGLERLERKYELVKEARGRGMLLGLELHPDENISVASVYWALLGKGFLVGYYPPGNLLRFDPPLTIEKADVRRLLEGLEAVLAGA